MKKYTCLAPLLFLLGCAGGDTESLDAEQDDPSLADIETGSLAAPELPGGFVDCGGRRFHFGRMTVELEQDDLLRAQAGFDTVDSCDRALEFEEASYVLMELQSPEEPYRALEQNAEDVEEEAEPGQQNIMNGTVSGRGGVVQLRRILADGSLDKSCTGVLISPRAILTAAHCFDVPAADNHWDDVRIDHWNFVGTIPIKSPAFSGEVRINRHPSYNGTASNDVAVVKLLPPSNFPNFTASDRHRIWTGYMSTLGSTWLYGTGFSTHGGDGLGILRYMPYNDTWANGDYFISKAGDTRACRGDSGGPVMGLATTGKWAVAGLHVQSAKKGSNECARRGGKQRAVRLQNKVAWIEDMIDVDCHVASTGNYVKCW